MVSKISHLVIPDPHAQPSFDNKRFDALSSLICDLKPTKVINMGDHWDFPSLSSYDKGTKGFIGKNYNDDVASGVEAQDRLWHKVRKTKKKQPEKYFLWGNHEQRLTKLLDIESHLEGYPHGVSEKDLQLDDYYQEVVKYSGNAPGILHLDGISYAHYLTSGAMGRPISGVNHARSLINHYHGSCTVGHSHAVNWATSTTVRGSQINGLVAGCAFDYNKPWAGQHDNQSWWKGVVFCDNVEDGAYNPRFIGLDTILKEYL